MKNDQLERLLLVDALNVVRRVYEANPAPDSDEKAAACVRSSLSSLRRALGTHRPSHAVAVFDFGGNTWRHDLFPTYKISRKPMAKELRDALPELKSQMKSRLGLNSVAVEYVEADDVIDNLARQWQQESLLDSDCVLLSTDKDLCVLLDIGIRVFNHFEETWRDEAWLLKKFGVPPSLLADLLAMAGDSSDDIPGIDRVGVKKAARLLMEYGSLASVLAAPAIPGKLGETVRASVAVALLSRQLVSFKSDCFTVDDWRQYSLKAS